jgi:hypothetical protein
MAVILARMDACLGAAPGAAGEDHTDDSDTREEQVIRLKEMRKRRRPIQMGMCAGMRHGR